MHPIRRIAGVRLELIYERTICRTGPVDVAEYVRQLRGHPSLGCNVPVVYSYQLLDRSIPYPRGPGRIVYLGESCRRTGTWYRFKDHIPEKLDAGKSTLINYTLGAYYHEGVPLRVRIHRVRARPPAQKHIEALLLNFHLRRFGALPMGQGTTSNWTPTVEAKRRKTIEKLQGILSLGPEDASEL